MALGILTLPASGQQIVVDFLTDFAGTTDGYAQIVKLATGAEGALALLSSGAGNIDPGTLRFTLANDDTLKTILNLIGLIDVTKNINPDADGSVIANLKGILEKTKGVLDLQTAAFGDNTPQSVAIASNGQGQVNTRIFAELFGVITRPGNTTLYDINDAISNSATAASVTAQTATVSDNNDHPVGITRIRVATNDIGFWDKDIQAYVYNSDPTLSTGIQNGDNAGFSVKMAGFVGTMSGRFVGFSNGGVAELIPDKGPYLTTKPVAGAKTIYYLLRAKSQIQPATSASTFTGVAEGFQGRA